MYLVKETFIAKPGHAGELAKLMKQSMKEYDARVLLDLVTNYNTIVVEYEIESLAAFDKMFNDYKTQSAKASSSMKGYTELYDTGKREIFKIVE